jgi:hypothetical protein
VAVRSKCLVQGWMPVNVDETRVALRIFISLFPAQLCHDWRYVMRSSTFVNDVTLLWMSGTLDHVATVTVVTLPSCTSKGPSSKHPPAVENVEAGPI